MNSINKNQPEENHEDLIADKAINKVQDLAKSAKTCFFCTTPSSSESKGTRPMTVQQVDDAGCFWFVSAKDSNQDADLHMTKPLSKRFGSPCLRFGLRKAKMIRASQLLK